MSANVLNSSRVNTNLQNSAPKPTNIGKRDDSGIDNRKFLELPISKLNRLTASNVYNPLPYSDDQALLLAIEQANDEIESDAEVRGNALDIISIYKTANAVDALSQIAIYDLSSQLRSKAVGALASFDHESVFEPIVLAGADPTREVRATAAKAMFRLSFDRGDAWTRIAEMKDESRMRQAARAAIEGGVVLRSFERLIHFDEGIVYEAYALTVVLARSGETQPIFETLSNHPNLQIKLALLQILNNERNDACLQALMELVNHVSLPQVIRDKVQMTINSYSSIAV